MIFYTEGGQSQASGADNGTKIKVILSNKDKYSISAMCKFLKIARSTLYYKASGRKEDVELRMMIQTIFKDSRSNYGARKIKVELSKLGCIVSRGRIRRFMTELGLVSNYTVKQYKVHRSTCNNAPIQNEVKRNFDRDKQLEVVVSDLTYVNVAGKWNLNEICIFHSDRGNEFKNKIIDDVLDAFNIKRSLSAKGCPYDNAVAEATYKIIKTEFAFNRRFKDFDELKLELFDYVNWFNNIRIHGSLGYLTPVAYRESVL